jgi:hypothetical protein
MRARARRRARYQSGAERRRFSIEDRRCAALEKQISQADPTLSEASSFCSFGEERAQRCRRGHGDERATDRALSDGASPSKTAAARPSKN